MGVYYIGGMLLRLLKKLWNFFKPEPPPFDPNTTGVTFSHSSTHYHIRVTPDRILYHSLDGPFFDDLYQRAWFVYGQHLDQDWFRSKGIDLLDKAPWFRNSMDRMIFLDNARKLRQASIGNYFRDAEGNYFVLEPNGNLRQITTMAGGGGSGSAMIYGGNGGVAIYGGHGGHGDSYTIIT